MSDTMDIEARVTSVVADKLEIIELANRFENAFDAGDIDGHMATWAIDELSFSSPFGSFTDHAEYRVWVSGFAAFVQQAYGGTRHLITNHEIQVDGDTAAMRCYLTVLGRGGAPFGVPGRGVIAGTSMFSDDRLKRTPQGWRFVHRTVVADQPAQSGPDTLQQIADELEIRALAARFSDAANRRDIEAFRTLWAPNAEWVVTEPFVFSARGADAIAAMVGERLGEWELFVQMTHSGVIALDGDRATARWSMHELARSRDGAQHQNNLAIYDDELVRLEGRWVFQRRTYRYQYFDATPLPGYAIALPDDLAR